MQLQALGMSGLIILLFIFIDLTDLPFVKNTLDLLELKSLDFRFRLRNAHHSSSPETNVSIIAIDEKSINEIGRWPWSRATMARLLDLLAQGSPRVIAFDILFSEPETSELLKSIRLLKGKYSAHIPPDPQSLDILKALEEEADPDVRFGEAIERAGTVILPVAVLVPVGYQSGRNQGALETDSFFRSSTFGMVKQINIAKTFFPIEAETIIPPIATVAKKARALGHVYYQPDRDGVLRWEYLVLKYGEDYYPTLSLQAARVALGIRREEMKLWLGEAVELGGIRIPTDERGRMLINYLGREGSFPTFSATDILHRRISSDLFKDKIVLIGTTALGTYDLKVTPLSANMPGTEKNATVIENILGRRFLFRTESMKFFDVLFIILFGVGLCLVLPRVRALYGAALAISLLTGYILLAQYLFEERGLWINLLYPASTILFTYSSITIIHFMTEERRGREMRNIFSSYVSPKVVAELVKDPDKARLSGERKELTVLFSDIKGFTSFSEKHPPEEVIAILNEYMSSMTDIIFRWDGTLDKFVGDAILVFWGAPVNQPDHAEMAVRCALNMRERLSRLQEKWRNEGREPLDAGIGINTGEMVVGNMGAQGKKMDYTVIGDHVNLGSRIESLTRRYNCNILISEFTYKHIKDLVVANEDELGQIDNIGTSEKQRLGHVAIRDLDSVKIKGREQPVLIYEVTGSKKKERAA